MKFSIFVMAAALGLVSVVPTMAQQDGQAVRIEADSMHYDGATGQATMSGHLVITRGDVEATAQSGTYDSHSNRASLSGGVSVQGPSLAMSAGSVTMLGQNEYEAQGDVAIHKGDRSLYGQSVTFNSASDYGTIDGGGRVVVQGSTVTAPHMEAWLSLVKVKASGGVNLTSDRYHVRAGSQSLLYTATPGQNDGVAVLTGDAWAVQRGNVVHAPSLRLKLADNSVETEGGRSTLVIVPNK